MTENKGILPKNMTKEELVIWHQKQVEKILQSNRKRKFVFPKKVKQDFPKPTIQELEKLCLEGVLKMLEKPVKLCVDNKSSKK